MYHLASYFAAFAICCAIFFSSIVNAACTDGGDLKAALFNGGSKIINFAQDQRDELLASLKSKLESLKNIESVVIEIEIAENSPESTTH